jgi:hypothetical protein
METFAMSKQSKRQQRERAAAAAAHGQTWSADAFVSRTSYANKVLYALIAVTAIALAFGIWRSVQTAANPEAPRPEQVVGSGWLVSNSAFHDFGTISMAAGNVSHRYRIRNTGAGPLQIDRIYTSCMCTRATLTTSGGRVYGPFGMPGHGFVPPANVALASAQEASVEIVFDPAAHGPSGIGRVERAITLRSTQGRPLELRFVAMVKP